MNILSYFTKMITDFNQLNIYHAIILCFLGKGTVHSKSVNDLQNMIMCGFSVVNVSLFIRKMKIYNSFYYDINSINKCLISNIIFFINDYNNTNDWNLIDSSIVTIVIVFFFFLSLLLFTSVIFVS